VAIEMCEHKWVLLEVIRKTGWGSYNTEYIRIDRFYCEKCLEQKNVEKRGYSREVPEWY